jgi:sialate O-acetylesterase
MRLAALFTDGMVLQRDCPIPVWGWAEAGRTITVELVGRSAQATAGTDGWWRAVLPALPAGGPHTLVVRGPQQAVIRDVLVGEVWVCSGQSNMEWPLEMSAQAAKVVAEADYPQIRLFTVPKRAQAQPADDVSSAWCVCTPSDVGGFSAVGYYFGRELHRRLNVPVGLINASWGGTVAQAWTDRATLEAEPELAGYIEELQQVETLRDRAPEQVAAQRAEFLAKLPQDAGNRGMAAGWARCDYDDSDWRTMVLPAYWNGVHPTNGVFWFRRAVDVPASWAGCELKLSLGAVDKSDDCYVNGVRVGGMNWTEHPDSWATPRNYLLPAGLIKPGRNVIAVRVVSNYTGGGMPGPSSLMRLHSPAASHDKPLVLTGQWRYCIEQDFGPAPKIPEPQMATAQNQPTQLFNGMIAPLIPYAVRGVIWYQGESNADDAARYRTLFPAMIRGWRRAWERDDLAFHFVQLCNYAREKPTAESDNSRWAELREAQAAALALPSTGMAVTIDIGEPNDIHPRNKEDVGKRLAYGALARTYGLDTPCRGPSYRSMAVAGDEVRVEFDHAGGLAAKDDAISGFALAGRDRIFHPATGTIDGTAVLLCSPEVPAPVAVRYGWADCPVCTLYNAAGLPAEPFRTDDWPVGPAVAC